jgi:hypothetical protein
VCVGGGGHWCAGQVNEEDDAEVQANAKAAFKKQQAQEAVNLKLLHRERESYAREHARRAHTHTHKEARD